MNMHQNGYWRCQTIKYSDYLITCSAIKLLSKNIHFFMLYKTPHFINKMKLMGVVGVEPTTCGLRVRCSSIWAIHPNIKKWDYLSLIIALNNPLHRFIWYALNYHFHMYSVLTRNWFTRLFKVWLIEQSQKCLHLIKHLNIPRIMLLIIALFLLFLILINYFQMWHK